MSAPQPLSPRSLLEVASFEMSAIGQEDIELVCWGQFVEAAKVNPGSILAQGLEAHTEDGLCQKIIHLAKEIFSPSMAQEKEWLQGEAQQFVKLISPHFIHGPLPPGIHGLEQDLFQLLGILYDLLGDHAQSAKVYFLAATYARENGNPLLAAKLFAELAKQVLSIDPKNEKIQKEATDWLNLAEEAFKDSKSGWQPIISCYQRVLELHQGNYAPSAKILERMGKIYESIPELQELARQSFVQAATYHGFVNHAKDQARNLEKVAICAAKLKDGSAAEAYKQAAKAYASVEDHFSATRCFSEAALYERAAFHSHLMENDVDAKNFYAKISIDDPIYDPNIYLKYTLLAADRLAEQQHKESAACFKEAAIYYEKNKQFLETAQCFEKLLEQRAKYKDHPKIKDFEILGKIADAYKQTRCASFRSGKSHMINSKQDAQIVEAHSLCSS